MRFLERLQCRLQVGLARNFQLVPQGSRRGGAARHVLVIAPRRLPTIDYYLQDLLKGGQEHDHRLVYDDEVERWFGARATESLAEGTRVILVRMPSSRWASVIEDAAAKVLEVVWLIDDDVVAAREDEWLPEDYRLKLLSDYLRFEGSFARLIDRVWASTPAVAARFPPARVEVRPPKPLEPPGTARRWVTIFYHGTAAHRREHAFLLPIFEQVQARLQHTVIEVSGDHALYRMYRAVPRLRVLHPMPWPDYLVHLHAGRYDIGLVPLLDTPFNRARSGIKALELAATGVQGILSQRSPYTEYAHLPGMQFASDEPSDWVERIVKTAGGFGERD